MKSQHIVPVLAAAIGFAVAWAVKPAGTPATGSPATAEKPGSNKPMRSPQRDRAASVTEKRPKEVNAGDFPLADLAEKGPRNRNEAKMLRLSEALDLSIDQQGAIISALEAAKASIAEDVPVILDMAKRGSDLEDALAKILTPEQLAKFEELRVRERENRTEARAQSMLAKIIEEIDLSPGQRDEALARLRQYTKELIQSIPASATLLLSTSLLPTDTKDLSVESVLELTRISEDPPAPDDPIKAHEIMLNRQREALEEQLRCFDGILTPAQMGQVHAAIAERQAAIDKLRQAIPKEMPSAETAPAQAPGFPPAPGAVRDPNAPSARRNVPMIDEDEE